MNLDDFRKSIAEISVYDMSCYSAIELCYMLGDKIKVCAEALNYLLTQGVKQEVVDQLEVWKNDGTLDTIINENLYSDLCAKVEEFKQVNRSLRPLPEIHFMSNNDYIGDCIIIKNRYNEYFMIDTGGQPDYNFIKSNINKIGITKIKYLFITHSHDDHIGNVSKFIKDFGIEKIYLKKIDLDFNKFGGDNSNQQFAHDCMIHSARDNNIPLIEYTDLEKIYISDEEYIQPYCVNYEDYTEYNSDSIPLLYNYKGSNILLMSDSTIEQQKYMIRNYNLPKVDILKLPHHGFSGDFYTPLVQCTYPVNCVINGHYLSCEKTRIGCQYYEANVYYLPHYQQNKGSVSFIIGENSVTTTAKKFMITNVFSSDIIEGKEIFLNEAGLPVGGDIINYKGRSYFMDYNYNLAYNDWYKVYPDNEYLWVYAKADGSLAQSEWIKHKTSGNWCYLKANCICAWGERLFIDGDWRTFNANGYCDNPPVGIE